MRLFAKTLYPIYASRNHNEGGRGREGIEKIVVLIGLEVDA